MSGNTFGRLFTVTTFGESHGAALGCVIDGCPPGLALSEADLQPELDRRKPGKSRFETQRREADTVEILSGVFEGVTTGTAIGLLIRNTDQRSKDYSNIKDRFRPNHADYAFQQKYGIRDYRGGGRASARETAMRVAAGAVAKKYLRQQLGLQVRAYMSQLGPIKLGFDNWQATGENPFFCAEPAKVPELETFMAALNKQGDSAGAEITIVATGMPVGLGEPVFDKLDADIASALMGINAVKGVQIGAGFNCINATGSTQRDELRRNGFLANNAGGIVGGISTGQDLVARIALKPTSSIRLPGKTIDIHGNNTEIATTGRHDPCVGVRATPIAEAMVALVLIDHYLRNRAQNADVQSLTPVIPAAASDE